MEEPSKECPLCGFRMEVKSTRPIIRFAGLVIVYIAVFSVIYALPRPRPYLWSGAVLASVAGWLMSRERGRWWCSRCCHVVEFNESDMGALQAVGTGDSKNSLTPSGD